MGNDKEQSSNEQLELAWQFVERTGVNVFLTGKAGTGKTTFLRRLKERSPKRMVVVAPTGVAAINAGGVTIHSFFQFPLAPYVPGSSFSTKDEKYRFSKEKKNIIRTLDLLVIDEISMVRADLLDQIDAVLRLHKDRHRPFGGVQLLMIGDLSQLAPVVKDSEWALLREYYRTPYFFGSHALQQTQHVTIELTHVYRQTDLTFVNILNEVRENRLTAESLARLNSRVDNGQQTAVRRIIVNCPLSILNSPKVSFASPLTTPRPTATMKSAWTDSRACASPSRRESREHSPSRHTLPRRPSCSRKAAR